MDSPADQPVAFHVSLNVADLERSIAFYRVLFGIEPAKVHDDYAKFELKDPPVVFSLVPRRLDAGGALACVGLHVADESSLRACRDRLESSGISIVGERADASVVQLQVLDPDGTVWVIGAGSAIDVDATVEAPRVVTADAPAGVSASWEHFVTTAAPERIPHADASLDEVRLTGTFNSRLDEKQREFLVREARRVLRPGGRVLVHGLMADEPFRESQPTLPGLAALVSRVPVQTEPIEALQAAGFVGIQIVKFCEKPWFEHEGVGLREVKILGRQPAKSDAAECEVVYRGPFREAVGDDGRAYPRGQRVHVTQEVWRQLRESFAAEEFEFTGVPTD
jgi:catechol 2,3-dioxygenase-like lactoylglutathione lyase family enzyme